MDDVSLAVKMMDEFPKGLTLLLNDAGQIPRNSRSLTGSAKVTDEL
jgi:hypothetical protein